MDSKQYKMWLEKFLYLPKAMRLFLLDHEMAIEFSKQEIISLMESPYFKVMLQDENFTVDPEFVISFFDDEEALLLFLITLKSISLKNAIIKCLSKDLCKWQKVIDEFLLLENSKRWFYQYVPIIRDLCLKDSTYLKYLNHRMYYRFLNFTEDFESSDIAQALWNDKDFMQYCFNNIQNISSNLIPQFLRKLKPSKYFKELFLEHKNNVYWAFLIQGFIRECPEFQSLILVVEDLLRMEHMELYDLIISKNGPFSEVYFLRNYVLKVGRSHFDFELPNSDSLLYPMFRYQNDRIKFYMEIVPICDTSNITLEDVYMVYKRERLKGNIWLDAKIENLGKLLVKNPSYDFEVAPETIGFVGENAFFRDVGDFVIIDLDFLKKESEIDWEDSLVSAQIQYGLTGDLERRYKEECQLKRVK